MRLKSAVEAVLRPYPPLFRAASKAYHKFNGDFRSLSRGAPEAVRRCVAIAADEARAAGREVGDYYEFGVFRGFTVLTAFEASRDLGLSGMRLYGFDSFEGLPEVEGIDVADGRFFKGQFAASKAQVTAHLTEHGVDWGRVELIEGYYDDVCTDALAEQLKPGPAAVVNLDCDLYASTKTALDWMTRHGLIVPGTVLQFDDYYSYGRDDDRGQPRNRAELEAAFPQWRLEPLFEYPDAGKVFIVREA